MCYSVINMRKSAILFLILNTAFSSAFSLASLYVKFYSSTKLTKFIPVHNFHFKQRLDHFNLFDDREFNQNYWVTVPFYRKGGPAFLIINGEAQVQERFGFQNAALSYAQRLNAICFSLEHRFYSRIQPVNGSIISHLSSAQALADIANFIKGVTKEFHLPKRIKWIVFGCSYAGALAAWARLKYPRLIQGAVASSAPLIAKVEYYEYEQIVEESLKLYDPNCVRSILLGFEEIAHLVNSPQNMEKILKMFYLDSGNIQFKNMDEIKKMIVYIMIDIFSGAVQNNEAIDLNIPLVCSIMIEHTGSKLEAFSEIRKKEIEYEGAYVNMPSVKNKRSRNIPDDNLVKWKYQQCSELGGFSSFANTTFLSPVRHLLTPIEMEIKLICELFFGPNVEKLNEKVSHTNSQYGGLDFNVSNTIFIHGSVDPWHRAGLYKKSKDSLYETIFIEGTSHCADIYPPSDKDILELKNARRKVLNTINGWLRSNTL